MSDPVTNVEIEDVLSSIRRLVSDGDKARTRDPAPSEEEAQAVDPAPFVAPQPPESVDEPKQDKLVLTPAFMVVDNSNAPEGAIEDQDAADDADANAIAEPSGDDSPVAADQPVVALEPLVLENPTETPAAEEDQMSQSDMPDRSALVATIAELEAAVGAGTNEYEPDGSEVANEAIAWPGSMSDGFGAGADDHVEEAEVIAATTPETSPEEAPQPEAISETVDDASAQETAPSAEDVYADDDDLDGLLDAGGVAIDEEALKDLVSEVVRAELSGPLGEKITRNVRKLVRREIYRILSSQDFD